MALQGLVHLATLQGEYAHVSLPRWGFLLKTNLLQDWCTVEFWNDFEGKTVAEKYRLDHLIGPKGRSAFFTTNNGTGVPSVIRLIESLNDEDQILARWNIVSTLQQEHLIKLKACGQTILDGTHLVYAVLESTDAELADILKERPLTAEETKQVAISIIDGLQTL